MYPSQDPGWGEFFVAVLVLLGVVAFQVLLGAMAFYFFYEAYSILQDGGRTIAACLWSGLGLVLVSVLFSRGGSK
ncbi:MAG: hypothetical protein M3P49_14610 [Actinomycetota bacterium]|nr:hypothetical protein [Actinomycetota bacterium]